MRSVVVIVIIFAAIVLAFSQVWLPKLLGWGSGVVTVSGLSQPLPIAR
ncbi:hypothetical protein [Mesorhizobium sp.]|nr:hypothetical protein [Mesorhizobium sp.]